MEQSFHPTMAAKHRVMLLASAMILLAALFSPVEASHKDWHQLGVESIKSSSSATHVYQPYRTAYHFQPRKNWMNDPNGPLYYKGWYHFFYQYNRDAAVWGNITWGHAVSRDMVHWRTLHTALKGDKWYDMKGVWSGSATFLDNGVPVLLYTGWAINGTDQSSIRGQTQAMAVPEDPSDPLLREWDKSPHNPIALAPPGFNDSMFRDPTEAWKGYDGVWRMLVGAVKETDQSIGTALLYKSTDFNKWNFTGEIQSVAGTGMWECPDIYPVHVKEKTGLRLSARGPHVKHVLKVSLDRNKHDYYSVGTYDEKTDLYTPDDTKLDTGLGLRYDYGKFYASKTFFDQNKNRRVLWGWANESSSVQDDIEKGWSSVQCLPRHIWLDEESSANLVQWPIEEVDKLRRNEMTEKNVEVGVGKVVPVKAAKGAQLDIVVDFALPEKSEGLEQNPNLLAEMGHLTCSDLVTKGSNAAGPHSFGPFGVHVLATGDLQERTSIFFHLIHDGKHQNWKTLFCGDQSQSSLQQDVDKTVYGSYVRVDDSDKVLSVRILVDHSIVESFAQGGRTVMTSRVYPELAVKDAAHVFLFNNGTEPVTVKSVSTWEMKSVNIKFYKP